MATKLWIASDQHYEIYGKPREFPIPEADVFVCAGDLMREPADAIQWLDVTVPFPTIYVTGNHEFYRGTYATWRDAGAAASAAYSKVDLLENGVSETGGIRFIGCTLSTDFALYGADTVEGSKQLAEKRMNDFRPIRYSTGAPGRGDARLGAKPLIHERADIRGTRGLPSVRSGSAKARRTDARPRNGACKGDRSSAT